MADGIQAIEDSLEVTIATLEAVKLGTFVGQDFEQVLVLSLQKADALLKSGHALLVAEVHEGSRPCSALHRNTLATNLGR